MEETFVTVLVDRYFSADTAAVLMGLLFVISEVLSFLKNVRANGILQAIINLTRRKEAQE
jgi:ABC-type methionine transport system permease subunit